MLAGYIELGVGGQGGQLVFLNCDLRVQREIRKGKKRMHLAQGNI